MKNKKKNETKNKNNNKNEVKNNKPKQIKNQTKNTQHIQSTQKNENKKNENNKKEKSKKIKLLIIKILLIAIILGIIISIIAAVIFFSIIVKEAPEFNPKNLYKQESSIVYDKKGNEIAKIGSEKREKIEYKDMPQILIDAIVATEDSAFFQHNGFNAARFLKATLSQVIGGGGGGASTLTMQVSKNAYTSNVSSGFEGIKRKFTDIYLSIFKIEKAYTKEEILEFYVNSYYMGGGAYGVEQACQNYFGKSVNNINLSEAAMLAGIYQAPGYYDPTIYPENTEARRKTVLNLMLRHGYITEEEKAIAEKMTVEKILNTKHTDGNDQINPVYKDFIDTLIEDVKEKTGYNPYTTPMLIYSTMDNEKQEYVTNVMNGNNFNWENDKVQAGVAVVDTNTGEIVAIGAGRHRENEIGWNYATMNRRHIGSTAKPLYDYGPLIEYKDASTYKLFYDEPYTYSNGVSMNNWDGGYSGILNMRDALKVSRNVPALKAFQENDNANIYDFVTKLGLSPEESEGHLHEAHAIGAYGDGQTTGENPLSMAAAYSAFANGGYYNKPHAFTKIVFRNSDEEYVFDPEKKQVMSDATAYMITDMLVSTSGYTTKATSVNGITYASKTGTSNFPDEILEQYHLGYNAVNDLWVAGYSRDFAVAVWYGYDQISSEYYNKMSSGGNINLYKEIIKGVYTGTENFTKPSSVVSVPVEKHSPGNGQLPSQYTPSGYTTTELYKAGTEPTTVSERFQQLPNVTNLKSSLNGNKITLSWNGIETPNALNRDYLRNQYSQMCKNVEACVNIIIGEDSSMLGNLVYNIYQKNSDGSLKYVDSTTNTSIEKNAPQNAGNKVTYVVKAAYSNNDGLSSGGVETSLDISSAIKEIITSSLVGEKSIEIGEMETYTDPGKNGVKVMEGTKNVTNDANITITYTLDGKSVTGISSDRGKYKITYTVSYKDHKNILTREVFLK